MNNEINTVPFAILTVLLTAAVAGGIGYFAGTKKTPEPVSQPIAMITVSPTPTQIPTSAVSPVPTEYAPTSSPKPSPTVKTSVTLQPTITIKPTATVKPTARPTLRPTSTPTSVPTATPTPVEVVNNSYYCGVYTLTNLPPIPASGSNPLFVTLYGSGGVTSGSSLIGFQWDYDGNGTWDSVVLAGQANRVYTTSGTYRPRFRIKGSTGEYGPACTYPYDVNVGTNVAYQNDYIAIDRLTVEATVSRSRQNYQFPIENDNLNNGGNRIYIPFMDISSKEKFTAIRIKTAYNSDYGYYEVGRDMNEGTRYHQHLFIDKSKPNGTYSGEFTITYTTDNGTVTKEAAVARYKITLID